MKNNIELFIKYLENDLTYHERELFDSKLIEESNFNEEFLKFSKLYNTSKSKIKVNERYFTTIVSNVRQRIEESKSSFFPRFAYLLPVIFIGLFFITKSFTNSSVNLDYDFENLLETFTEDEKLIVDLFSNALDFESIYFLEEDLLSEYYINDVKIDESVFEYLEDNLSVDEVNNNLINQLSDNEFNTLYEELIDKTIL